MCFAVGRGGTILTSTDGGATWRRQVSKTDSLLKSVSCLNPRICVAGGYQGALLRTDNAGATWVAVPQDGAYWFDASSCSSTTACYLDAAYLPSGYAVVVRMTANGDISLAQSGFVAGSLNGISCRLANGRSGERCVAVGNHGVIVAGEAINTTAWSPEHWTEVPESAPRCGRLPYVAQRAPFSTLDSGT